jgi:hypothetical protein
MSRWRNCPFRSWGSIRSIEMLCFSQGAENVVFLGPSGIGKGPSPDPAPLSCTHKGIRGPVLQRGRLEAHVGCSAAPETDVPDLHFVLGSRKRRADLLSDA